MASTTSRGRRPATPLLLALLVGLAVAMPLPALAAAPRAALTEAGSPVHRWTLSSRADEHVADWPLVSRAGMPVWRFQARVAALLAIAESEAAAEAARIAAEQAAAQKAAAAKAAAAKAAADAAAKPVYRGTNHVWMPSLGVSRSVEGFSCSRSTPPGNVVYRWGCAGTNNVYLFGHAWGVMKPLHDAYVSGRLKAGMAVVYADGKGRVRTYRVTEIRVVTPDQVDWAIAAQSRPSMTLQTCVGKNSEKRLLVRLVSG
ncbi:MAG TPA: sortase [Candidatus Limnocylindrales bacterium]|nr:sortase [Candidatus Limnocylindrales bacterium]